MARFYKQHGEKKPTIPSEHGTTEKQEYRIEIDKVTGHKMIKEAGRTNTYAKIQRSKDASDINMILAKATRGDLSGFKKETEAVYGDISMIPDNMIEIANLKLKSDQAWEKLPVEIRREYDHDKDKYFRDFGSEHWFKLHGMEKSEENKTDIPTDKENKE